MIFVVEDELIPKSQRVYKADSSTIGTAKAFLLLCYKMLLCVKIANKKQVHYQTILVNDSYKIYFCFCGLCLN